MEKRTISQIGAVRAALSEGRDVEGKEKRRERGELCSMVLEEGKPLSRESISMVVVEGLCGHSI